MAFQVGGSSQEVVTGEMTAERETPVLIVDDDSFVRKFHTTIASRLGFSTVTAENGQQAIEHFQSGAHFNFIIMDFEMPIMNGIEATTMLREMGVDCRILAVTASEDPTVRERFIEAGANQFLTKPLNVAKLANALRNM